MIMSYGVSQFLQYLCFRGRGIHFNNPLSLVGRHFVVYSLRWEQDTASILIRIKGRYGPNCSLGLVAIIVQNARMPQHTNNVSV